MSAYMYFVAKGSDGITFNLEEGNFTRSETYRGDNGVIGGGSYQYQLADGDMVELYTSADMTVQKSATGTQVGFIDGDPIYENPASSLTSGNYTRAKANVVVMGADLYKVKLDASNQAISVGHYLAIDTTNKNVFDREEDTTTNIIAVEAAAQNSGATIRALVFGRPAVEADAGA
jgi:hypothetical protein